MHAALTGAAQPPDNGEESLGKPARGRSEGGPAAWLRRRRRAGSGARAAAVALLVLGRDDVGKGAAEHRVPRVLLVGVDRLVGEVDVLVLLVAGRERVGAREGAVRPDLLGAERDRVVLAVVEPHLVGVLGLGLRQLRLDADLDALAVAGELGD